MSRLIVPSTPAAFLLFGRAAMCSFNIGDIGNGTFEPPIVMSSDTALICSMSARVFCRLSDGVFFLFFERPWKHLNTHCERIVGKSRSRHDSSSLSLFYCMWRSR
jgi:hypothetical protein